MIYDYLIPLFFLAVLLGEMIMPKLFVHFLFFFAPKLECRKALYLVECTMILCTTNLAPIKTVLAVATPFLGAFFFPNWAIET